MSVMPHSIRLALGLVLVVPLICVAPGCRPEPAGKHRIAIKNVRPKKQEPALERWSSTGGPLGAQIEWITVSPTFRTDRRILAGGLGWAYQSTDAGRSWSRLTAGRGNVFHVHLASGPEASPTMFACKLGGVFRSTDGGRQWNRVQGRAEALASAPNYAEDPTVLALTDSGLAVSRDGGAHWSKTLTSGRELGSGRMIAEPAFKTIAFSPDYPNDRTVFAWPYGRLFRSTDRGRNWTAVQTSGRGTRPLEDRISALALSPTYKSDKTLYMGTHFRTFRSMDGGRSWSVVQGAPERVKQILFSPRYSQDRTIIACASNGSIYKSTDGGVSWVHVSKGPVRSVGALTISPAYDERGPDRTVFGGDFNGSGFYISRDGGATWAVSSSGMSQTHVSSLAVSPDYANDHRVVALAWRDEYRSYESTHAGFDWALLREQCRERLIFSPGYVRDGTAFGLDGAGRIFRSPDRGMSWRRSGTVPGGGSLPPVRRLYVAPSRAEARTLFAVMAWRDGGLFRSTDSGAHWTAVDSGMETPQCLAVSPGFARDKTIFCSGGNGIHKSTDGGAHWVASYAGLSGDDRLAASIAVSPSYARDHTVYAVGGSLRRSTNGGKSWRKLGGPPGDVAAIAISARHARDHTLFATFKAAVYKSSDMGTTWTKWGSAQPDGMPVRSLALSPNVVGGRARLFAGTEEGGVYFSDVGSLRASR